jgi:hypothetical protein
MMLLDICCKDPGVKPGTASKRWKQLLFFDGMMMQYPCAPGTDEEFEIRRRRPLERAALVDGWN